MVPILRAHQFDPGRYASRIWSPAFPWHRRLVCGCTKVFTITLGPKAGPDFLSEPRDVNKPRHLHLIYLESLRRSVRAELLVMKVRRARPDPRFMEWLVPEPSGTKPASGEYARVHDRTPSSQRSDGRICSFGSRQREPNWLTWVEPTDARSSRERLQSTATWPFVKGFVKVGNPPNSGIPWGSLR